MILQQTRPMVTASIGPFVTKILNNGIPMLKNTRASADQLKILKYYPTVIFYRHSK